MGKALLGHKVGDRVKIQVSDTFAYYVQIQQVEKTGEDPDLPISTSLRLPPRGPARLPALFLHETFSRNSFFL